MFDRPARMPARSRVEVVPCARMPWNAPATFTYRSAAASLAPGTWVRIPFRRTTITGVITGNAPRHTTSAFIKDIDAALPRVPLPRATLTFILDAASRTCNHPSRFLPSSSLFPASIDARPRAPSRASVSRPPRLLWWSSHETQENELLDRTRAHLHGTHLILVPTLARAHELHTLLAAHGYSPLLVAHARRIQEKKELFRIVLDNAPFLIIGTRSSLFLPFSRLDAVTIDEEEHWAYRQERPPPRYHARTLALALATLHRADTLLLTPSPSLVAFHYWHAEKTHPALATRRAIEIIDRTSFNAFKDPLAPRLLDLISSATAQKSVTLILTDTQGYAPLLQCGDCRYSFRCVQCAHILTAESPHAKDLACNRCGYREIIPPFCPVCSGARLRHAGFGPSRMIEYLLLHDIDARKYMHEHHPAAHGCFVGTIDQDFSRLIAGSRIICAHIDPLLARPAFTASERALHTLMRLSCAVSSGTLFVQTAVPDHPVLAALGGSADAFYRNEIALREKFNYPPFSTLIRIALPVKKKAGDRAHALYETLLPRVTPLGFAPLPSSHVYRRRTRALIFTLRYPHPVIPSRLWDRCAAILKDHLPADAIIDTEPESI
ncbi:hypothetical protein A3J43_00760 [Candidatus Uhrbacteria bacterium RIFCSPHIGHO2_12_FULL_54_23]|uniref:Primosomal protein N' 3' DNA-binding domain-containing protein n=2 Tax=Candidatus Uhriibacteriota TaxID=1752732 RepID=A0A1F7UJM4_9BACT|nr:MAG: hypothetical protein A3J43_00760 [Candidatus Uhrbacteria bacterium RIFCSPHIGHO2_12_FULL_54_23]